jgi:hypothetical protein
VRAYLFEQMTPLLGGQRLNEVLLSRGKHTFEAHDQQVADQMRARPSDRDPPKRK